MAGTKKQKVAGPELRGRSMAAALLPLYREWASSGRPMRGRRKPAPRPEGGR